jgi:hypothetical protein
MYPQRNPWTRITSAHVDASDALHWAPAVWTKHVLRTTRARDLTANRICASLPIGVIASLLRYRKGTVTVMMTGTGLPFTSVGS